MTGDQQSSNLSTNLNQRLNVDFALQAAGLGVWELDPITRIVHWDDRCRQLFGLTKDNQLPYQQAIQYIHPDDVGRVERAVQWVLNPDSGGHYDITYRTLGGDDGLLRWVRFMGQSYFNEAREVYRFAGVAQEVTDKVAATKKLEESESRFRTIVEQSPAPIALLWGKEMIVETANAAVLASWGKEASILGKPLIEAIPELKGQPFLALLDGVYTTGEAYSAYDAPAKLLVYGKLEEVYYDFVYAPVRDTAGAVMGVMVLATVVTEQVLARQKVEQAESALRGAIELAELGTWSIDLPADTLDYSPRLRDWLGIGGDEIITVERAYQAIRVADRARVREAILAAIAPNSVAPYDVEYVVNTSEVSKQRILHAQGKALRDETGVAYKISGTVQDVTLHRNMQVFLEQQVQDRTEELEATVEELAATNEELTAATEEIIQTNKRLEESNLHLIHSNQNLEQFAYIASHDLQEPLRKIQQFGDLLKTRFGERTGDELVYLERMQSAASRMSLLIKDLLAFSRISTSQAVNKLTPLNEVLTDALDNLSLVIEETKAQLQLDDLPTVQGDRAQLSQLFFNLLSNAIKFSRKDSSDPSFVPQIKVKASQVAASDLRASIKPTRLAGSYHLIEVIDNGVGFDEKYLDRIFQVFQRLHGKNEFAGTGVGLAIVQKVVTNHGGAITATSKPGQGATFSVYLPA